MNNIKDKYIQYGLMGFILRCIKFMLRKIGITYESYYCLENDLEKNKSIYMDYYSKHELLNVRRLNLEDFIKDYNNSNRLDLTKEKIELYKIRFKNDDYIPFGVYDNDGVIYYCWLSLVSNDVPKNIINDNLNTDTVLFVDDYCIPKERGKGIHNFMNSYRCKYAYNLKKKAAIVYILCGNKPAFKAQTKVGFNIKYKFYILNLWGNIYTNYHK